MEYDYDINITNLLFGIFLLFLLIFVILAIIQNLSDFSILFDKTKYEKRLNNGKMPLFQKLSPFSITPMPNMTLSPLVENTILQPLKQQGPLNSSDLQIPKPGNLVSATSDYVTDVLKVGLDITNNGVKMAGNLLDKSIYGAVTVENFDDILNTSSPNNNQNIESNPTTSPIQSQVPAQTQSKTKWCYIGEFKKKRGCAEIANDDYCSGDTFDNYQRCQTLGLTKDPSDPKSFLSSESTKLPKKYNFNG